MDPTEWSHIIAKSGITDFNNNYSCMYRKTPMIFVKTTIFVQFQVQIIDTSADQTVANSKACAQQ
jgi:hypothetical protein